MKAFSILIALVGCLAAAAYRDDNTTVITRVVNLLTQLKGTIEEDGATEQKAYDQLACWCTESTGRSASIVNEVNAEIESLGTHILELTGKVGTLEGEISGLIQDIKDNEVLQASLTSAREKENAKFMAESAEQSQALAAIEKALIVLTGATTSSASLLQTSQWRTVFSSALTATSRASSHVKLSTRQLAALTELTRSQASGSYAPQSATIQGILQDMYTTFSSDLESDTTTEANANKAYEELMDTHQAQHKLMNENLVKKESQKAEAELMLADGSQSYEDNQAKLKAETELHETTKASCSKKTEEWSARSALRTEELQGINEAIALLTTDEARDLFTKAIKPGFASPDFLQVDSSKDDPAQKAFRVLQTHARASNSTRLAALAAKLMLGRGRVGKAGHFDDVLQAIDTLVGVIESQKIADTKQVDLCISKYHDSTMTTDDLKWQIEKNKAKVDKIAMDIDNKEKAKDATVQSITDLEKELDDLEKKRGEENTAFLEAKSDDEKAIALLKEATAKLSEYYEKNGIAISSMLQRNESIKPEPEFKLSGKDSRKNSAGGVVKMLTMIITDLENEVKVAIQVEEAAQADYEAMVASRNDSIDKLKLEETNLKASIAEQGTAKTNEEGAQTSNEGLLTNEETALSDIKPDCDKFISGQAERRRKMDAELEGLRTAKEFLLGALPSLDLLQKHTSNPALRKTAKITKHGLTGFDDSVFPRITFQAVSFLQSRRATSAH